MTEQDDEDWSEHTMSVNYFMADDSLQGVADFILYILCVYVCVCEGRTL